MKSIKVGLASYGMSGRVFHAPLISVHPAFELTAICERTKDSASVIYPKSQIVKTFDQLISITEIDLIVVNTPDTTHFDFTKKALLAGKNVVVEKPFVFTVSEGKELIELAKRQNRILSIFQNRRWDGDFLTVKNILKEKRLGRIVEFRSSFQRFRNYVVPNTWKEENNRHVGITYNLGSHLVDQAFVLFGMPQGVFARIATQRNHSLIDDYFHIILIYPDIQVSLSAGYLMREETPRFVIHGTSGSFVKYGIDPQEEDLKNGKIPDNDNWGTDIQKNWGIINTEENGVSYRKAIKTENGNYLAFYDNIADCILQDKPLSVLPEDNLKVISILEAAFESQTSNKIIFIENK